MGWGMTNFVGKSDVVRTQEKRCRLIILNIRTGFCQISREDEGNGEGNIR